MSSYQHIVVKLGTSTLTAGTPRLSPPQLVDLVRQMAHLHDQGCDVAVVSSGAIAAGRERLNFPHLSKDIPIKQMLAAIGQPRLMALYEQLFGLYGVTVAQVLLTRSDLADRRRYLNSRNTLMAIMSQGVIPIVNENDTVATEEIRVGDNDNLSALVANLIEADLLVMLTDQSGLYTADPRRDPDAQLVQEVSGPEIPAALWQAASDSATGLGTGGMLTKLQAVDLARRSGATAIIARGSEANVLQRLAKGEPLGSQFHALGSVVESRKRYLLAGGRARGRLYVDSGAAHALQQGGSLLPVGISRVEGKFQRGDTVNVTDASQHDVARGMVNYTSEDLAHICGRHSEEIEGILGFVYGDEVIHRNNMVLL